MKSKKEKEPVMIERLKINTSTDETQKRYNNNDMFYTDITDYNRSPFYLTFTNHNQNDSIDHTFSLSFNTIQRI